jgi:FAD/FMN-containing dehydrogenase/Fe-S oxidoreductase
MALSPAHLRELQKNLRGRLHVDDLHRRIYATDASVYRELPLGVAYPKDEADLQTLVRFADSYGIPLIPRAGGTSLAGQCVGAGLVVDTSRHLNRILDLDVENRLVRLQPGVIRDELNRFLRPHGLFFGPNISTANRAMIGGMVGNNSCGSTSIVYGSIREHTRALRCVLSDGSPAAFGPLDSVEVVKKTHGQGLEAALYRQLLGELGQPAVQQRIRDTFPRPEVSRRNTGYAVDQLLPLQPFRPDGPPFNFCKLLCGSEGTLALTSEIALELDPLPEPELVLLCAHFESVHAALEATLLAMEQQPSACELMDRIVLDCTRDNLLYQRHRFFLEGEPAAVLVVEFRGATAEEARNKAQNCAQCLRTAGLGYAYPLVGREKAGRVWDLRKAGLGLLANVPGDAKPVACIEDTAVALEDLPAYIREFEQLMDHYGQQAVYYAHAGAGELHLRPMLNLKARRDRQLFYEITRSVAGLVRKYRGSLSGEHGDGRVRAEFIPLMLGRANYELLRRIKAAWDPKGILNPGKIVDPEPMQEHLRYEEDQPTPRFDTILDFSDTGGILRLAEKCNGSGDCRKLHTAGGTMCPSYHATRNEKDTTRARANALREYLTQNEPPNPFDQEELREVLDLCLSCKGCTAECPSNVDMTALKAEFTYQYQRTHGVPLRHRLFASIGEVNRRAARYPGLSNFFLSGLPGAVGKAVLGVAQKRSLPRVHEPLMRWWEIRRDELRPAAPAKGRVLLYVDEFTNYNDGRVGRAAVRLLHSLGYAVELHAPASSGRAHLSKGLLEEARTAAEANVRHFHPLAKEDSPVVGLEPSAILSFRDEYPRLLRGDLQQQARELAPHTLLLEEFLAREARAGRIGPQHFTGRRRTVLLHGHCHQKALSGLEDAVWALSLPPNYHVEVIPAGCCGMAGSFGYEKEHYALSMQIGELVLFPAVRRAVPGTLLAAAGTSCRHQIRDGTRRSALHPAELLWRARRKN